MVLLIGELMMRSIESHLPRRFSGDEAEVELKYDELRSLDAAGHNPVDILFLGDSTMDAALDPAVFAQASNRYAKPFNGALLGQQLSSAQRWAKEFVLPQVKPRTVVLGVSPIELSGGDLFGVSQTAVEAAFDNTYDRLHPSPLGRLDADASKESALVRNRSTFRSPVEIWRALSDMVTGKKKNFFGGVPTKLEDGQTVLRSSANWKKYFILPRGGTTTYWGETYNAANLQPLGESERKSIRNNTVDIAQITRLLNIVEASGAGRIVLLIPPTNLRGLIQAGGSMTSWNRNTNTIKDFAKDHDLPLIDFSRADWPDDDYFDIAHLSKKGSARFSTELASVVDAL